MKIGLISDTHVPNRISRIPSKVFEVFSDVDLIMHAGDLCELSVIHDLEEIAPVVAVQGNMDAFNGLNLSKSKVTVAEDVRIGLNHGDIRPRGDTQQLYYMAKELDVDIMVTGHTHVPMIEQVKDVLLVNPGSPSVPRLSDPSVMVLSIYGKDIDIEAFKVGGAVCSGLQFAESKLRED